MLNAFLSLAHDLKINNLDNFVKKISTEADNESLIIKVFEGSCNSELFTYKVIQGNITSESKIQSSLIVYHEHSWQFLKYANGGFFSKNGGVKIRTFEGCRYLLIREVVNIIPPKELLREIINFTPVWSMLALLLTPFILVTPIYTNIFNTRLIYSNNASTLAIVSLVFLSVYVFEFFAKKKIKTTCISANANSALLFERYTLKLTPYYRGFSSVHSVKTIEQYRKMIWDFIPNIASDILTYIILFIALSVFISWYSVFFILFYAVIFGVFYLYRSRLYKLLIDLENASNDVLKLRMSNISIKDNIPYVNRGALFNGYLITYANAQYYEDKITHFNFYWDELTKLVSFLALFVLFLISFIGISSSEINPSYMIVLFIIGSRMSTSVVQIVTRLSYLQAGIHHINKSLQSLITEGLQKIKAIDDVGLNMNDVAKIKVSNLSIVKSNKQILSHVSVKFVKGHLYGIKGAVGSGKSTFLNALVGLDKDYTGKIEYDGVDINMIDSSFMQERVCFLTSSSNQFFSGTLVDNFIYRNCNSKATMDAILRECFGERTFDYQTLYVDDIDSVAMSTGQKRKLLFMLSLLDKSKLYVFDEVLINISKNDIARCLNLMRSFVKDSIIVMTSHNDSILSACDVVYEINSGTLAITK